LTTPESENILKCTEIPKKQLNLKNIELKELGYTQLAPKYFEAPHLLSGLAKYDAGNEPDPTSRSDAPSRPPSSGE
jgi:hypothetical protein